MSVCSKVRVITTLTSGTQAGKGTGVPCPPLRAAYSQCKAKGSLGEGLTQGRRDSGTVGSGQHLTPLLFSTVAEPPTSKTRWMVKEHASSRPEFGLFRGHGKL